MKPSVQPPRTPSRLSDSVHHQLNMYALAASAAGLGLLALSQPAQAKIIYTKTHKLVYNGVYLDLQNNGAKDFVFQSYYGCDCDAARVSFGNVGANHNGFEVRPHPELSKGGIIRPNDSIWVVALSKGAVIGPKSPFSEHRRSVLMGAAWWSGTKIRNSSGSWVNVSDRYIGLKFVIKGKTHYGWARLSVSFDRKFTYGFLATLTGYAYEAVANRPIIAGETKYSDDVQLQPASLGHLARGASAISAWRGTQTAAPTH